MWHKTQHTENLFGGRKYLPDPAPPAHAPVSAVNILTISLSLTSLMGFLSPLWWFLDLFRCFFFEFSHLFGLFTLFFELAFHE
jgi:hypothetical protein